MRTQRHPVVARIAATVLLATMLTACAGRGPAPSQPVGTIPPPSASPSADVSGTKPRVLDPELLSKLDSYVQDAMRRYDVPGVEIGVVQDGKIVHLASFGVREFGKGD